MRQPSCRVLLLSALLAAGCGLAPDEGDSRDPAASAAGLRFVTYNAGLAHGAVALAEERLPLLPAELKGIAADVLCLNEVWTDADYEAIRRGIEDELPFSFRKRTTDSSWPKLKCLPWTVWRLNSCVKSSCTPKGISADECVRTACKARYDVLSDGCKICLAANTASPLDCVIWGARDFAFEGRNGLALFSRLPFDEEPSYQALDTAMIKRGVITATVAGARVQCTHLSSDLGVVPYPRGGTFSSWRAEQAAQVDVLDAGSEEGCTVLMGDLNTGPGVAGITAEVPSTYQALRDRGFEESWPLPRCTFCKDNRLAGVENDLWLDHVMVKGCSDVQVSYSRVMEREVQVVSEGETLETRLSDHYGLAAEVRPLVHE